MPTLSLSPVRLVLLALGGTVIIGITTVAGLLALWQPRGLEALLPADRTLAFFSDVRWSDMQQFAGQYPSLRRVPAFQERLTLGVIALPGGSDTWVLASRAKEIPLPSTNVTINRQELLADDESIAALLASASPRLQAEQSFGRLTADMDASAPWIFFRTDAASASALLPSLVRPMLHASGAVLLRRGDAGSMLRIAGLPALPVQGTLQRPLPSLTPEPDVSLAVQDGHAAVDAWLFPLPESERAVREGMLSRKAAELLGGEWSTAYDILPLLDGETAVHWKTGTGGGIRFQMEGSADGDLAGRLDDIHDRFRSDLTGAVVVRRTLEKGFGSSVVHDDPAAVEDRRYGAGGWTVRESRGRASGKTLLTAWRGARYILSTDREWLAQAIAASDGQSWMSPGRAFARGALSPKFQQTTLEGVAAHPAWIWLGAASVTGKPGMALWAAEFHGQAMTLSFTLPQL